MKVCCKFGATLLDLVIFYIKKCSEVIVPTHVVQAINLDLYEKALAKPDPNHRC